jgi:hypothetical protein
LLQVSPRLSRHRNVAEVLQRLNTKTMGGQLPALL